MRAKTKEQPTPKRLSIAEKYKRLGMAQTDKQRRILSLIINASADGKWFRYADAEREGIRGASRRMAELMQINGIRIHRRDAAECGSTTDDEKNYHFSEFCVY